YCVALLRVSKIYTTTLYSLCQHFFSKNTIFFTKGFALHKPAQSAFFYGNIFINALSINYNSHRVKKTIPFLLLFF
ncbi:MAG: hypothetical protein LUH14_02640, partial [Clostridiaceae bacterium]|nr:hypothetical protein [Clostridiaceae bacterium]